MNMKKMKKHGFLTGAVLVLGLILAGCGNPSGSKTSDTTPGAPKNRIFFIKMDEETEASGTLSWIYEGEKIVRSLSKKAASFTVDRETGRIVFAEILTGYSRTYIAVMNTDGTGYQRFSVQGSNPCFSKDAARIYFDDGSGIYHIKADGTDKQEIDLSSVTGSKRYPRFSPDGTKLAFYAATPGPKWYSDDEVYLYMMDIDSGSLTRLNSASIPVSSFCWKPDGTEIVFNTLTGVTPPVRNLYAIQADDSGTPELLADDDNPNTGACGFPFFLDDGRILCSSTKDKKLYYRSSWDGSHYLYELAVMQADGSGLTILLPGVPVRDPVWIAGK